MQLITVSVWGVMLFAGVTAAFLPGKEAALRATEADVEASAFVAYQSAAARYIQQNPAAPAGQISLSNIMVNLPMGVTLSTNYTNAWVPVAAGPVAAGLYVYSVVAPSSPGVYGATAKRMGRPMTLGTYHAGTPSVLVSIVNPAVSMAVPTMPGVPNGALVMYGY